MLAAGQSFDRYVIEAPIGEGGMGEVYRAFDSTLRRKVALKIIHPDLAIPDAAARLVREARAAAALTHPNTVAIFDLGEKDGAVFLVMELIAGHTLRAFVGDTAIPLRRKIRWLVDIARGLAAAHRAGLVHRDVKPANVMVSDDGVVKVLDFGLAKPVEANSFHTDAGMVVGTPRYMAAELFTGARADARSDQYAFGVTAYELLSGVYPGRATGPVAAALDELVPELSPAVATIVAKTLSREPNDRYATMADVADALEEEMSGASTSVVRNLDPTKPSAVVTRREGAAADGRAADVLALAPTELPTSASASASPSRPPAAARTGAITPLLPTVARRPSRAPLVAVLVAMLLGGGLYAGSRLLGSDGATATDAGLDAAVEANADDASAEASADADAAGAAAADEGGAADAGGVLLDDDASGNAGDVPDAALESGSSRRLPSDDFVDPWTKPKQDR